MSVGVSHFDTSSRWLSMCDRLHGLGWNGQVYHGVMLVQRRQELNHSLKIQTPLESKKEKDESSLTIHLLHTRLLDSLRNLLGILQKVTRNMLDLSPLLRTQQSHHVLRWRPA